MLKPDFKISLRKGKLRIKSDSANIAPEIKDKFESLSQKLSEKYYNLLIESYLEDINETFDAVNHLSNLLLNKCLTKLVGDAYIILENESRYPPVSFNILGKKVTIAFNGHKADSLDELGNLICVLQDKISPQEGFTIKFVDEIDYGRLIEIIRIAKTSKLYEVTILTSNIDMVERVIKEFGELNYVIVKEGDEDIFTYQRNLGYLYVVYNRNHLEESFIPRILEGGIINNFSALELVEIRGNARKEDIERVVLFSKLNGYTSISIVAEGKKVSIILENERESKLIKNLDELN